jgi:sugar phosphate isomerase/epimerase
MNHPWLTRRAVVGSLAAISASACTSLAFGVRLTEPSHAAVESIKFGAQTNAWPIDPRKFDTVLAALREISNTGYAGFETGFLNLRSQAHSLPEARRQIEATGLKFIGVHIFLPEYDVQTNIAPRELYESVAQAGAALGGERLIFSGAPAVTPEEIQRKGDALNRAAAYARPLGLKVAYHNHWPEYKYNGREIEALYAETDPTLVWFLLDAGHAYRTGIDLTAFLRTHQQRITGIHFRDYKDRRQVPLGEGAFPLKQVAEVLKETGWSGWAMNEEEREDGTKQALAVIQPAFEALKGAFLS